MIEAALRIYAALEVDESRLKQLQQDLTTRGTEVVVQLTVKPEQRGGIRVAFKDPRRYLVGREQQIKAIANGFCSQQHYCCELMYGTSGVGKTTLAIAVAYELQAILPMQIFMEARLQPLYTRARFFRRNHATACEASSPATLRLELARFAR